MAAEARILEWTGAKTISQGKNYTYTKEYKTIIKIIKKWDNNKIMSPAHHPPKSEVKDSLELSEECKLLDFYMKGKNHTGSISVEMT